MFDTTRIPSDLRTLMERYFPNATLIDLQNIAKLTRSDRQWLESEAAVEATKLNDNRHLLDAIRLKFTPSLKPSRTNPRGPLSLQWWSSCAASRKAGMDWVHSQTSSLPRWDSNLLPEN